MDEVERDMQKFFNSMLQCDEVDVVRLMTINVLFEMKTGSTFDVILQIVSSALELSKDLIAYTVNCILEKGCCQGYFREENRKFYLQLAPEVYQFIENLRNPPKGDDDDGGKDKVGENTGGVKDKVGDNTGSSALDSDDTDTEDEESAECSAEDWPFKRLAHFQSKI